MVVFGAGPRFPNLIPVHHRPAPGPDYKVESTLQAGASTGDHRDYQNNNVHSGRRARALDVPAKQSARQSRSDWLQIPKHPGPTEYTPSERFERKAPSACFGKGSRFVNPGVLYQSNDHVRVNLGMSSPGPKYEQPSRDIVQKKRPSWSFGARPHREHRCYLEYIWTKTSIPGVGPATYAPRFRPMADPKGGTSRAVMAKGPRFRSADKSEFISSRHNAMRKGIFSPGPKYCPQTGSIAESVLAQAKKTGGGALTDRTEDRSVRPASSAERSKPLDRSQWLRGSLSYQKGGGPFVARVMKEDCSPGPGAYNVISSFPNGDEFDIQRLEREIQDLARSQTMPSRSPRPPATARTRSKSTPRGSSRSSRPVSDQPSAAHRDRGSTHPKSSPPTSPRASRISNKSLDTNPKEPPLGDKGSEHTTPALAEGHVRGSVTAR